MPGASRALASELTKTYIPCSTVIEPRKIGDVANLLI